LPEFRGLLSQANAKPNQAAQRRLFCDQAHLRAVFVQMGGGCQSPVAAYAEIIGDQIRLRAVSFRDEKNVRRGEARRPIKEAADLGRAMADELR